MLRLAYLFERFPSFSQTFCYREVAQLDRKGAGIEIYSIREPRDEPPQDWDSLLLKRIQYLPEEAQLTREIEDRLKRNDLPKEIVDWITEWGRRPDFLRLYQGIFVGSRLQKSGVDHVHAHFAGLAARTAFWIDKFFGIPFSFTAHANDIFAPKEFEIDLGKLVGAARNVIVVSDYGANFLRGRFPQDAAKIQRIYNGLDLSTFQRASFTAAIPTIVAIGRLIPKKGFVDLVQACALLRDHGLEFRCEIIGEGPTENELRAAIAGAGLDSHVILAGAQTQQEIVKRLAAARVFVLPSVVDGDGARDNLPTVIMEAMAAGLPVVSTSVGGIPEMVVDNETGMVVPPGVVAALAVALEKAIVDLALAKELGARGRERAEELFSIEKNVRDLLATIVRERS